MQHVKKKCFILWVIMCIMLALPSISIYAREDVHQEQEVDDSTGTTVTENGTQDEGASEVETQKGMQQDSSGNNEEEEQEVGADVEDKSVDPGEMVDSAKKKGKEGVEIGKNAISKVGGKTENAVHKAVYRFWEAYFSIHGKIKNFTPMILSGSICIGAVITAFSRKNKGMRRWSAITLCGIIPLFNLMVTYGMPYIYYMVNENAVNEVSAGQEQDSNADFLFCNLKQRGNNVMGADNNGNAIDQSIYTFWDGYAGVHDVLKEITPLILLDSISLGIVIAVLAKKNKSLRKWSVIALCGVIPCINIFILCGIPFLQKVFR